MLEDNTKIYSVVSTCSTVQHNMSGFTHIFYWWKQKQGTALVYRVKSMPTYEVLGEKPTTQNDAIHPDSRHFEEIHVGDIKSAVDGWGLKGKRYIYDIKLFYV